MQYKCEVCQDTGSTTTDYDSYNCVSCNVVEHRLALDTWLEDQYKNGLMRRIHGLDAWNIYRAALAMAPKQEADHINDVVKMVAPAGWKLVPEDPTGNMLRAAAKIDNEMFAGGSSHGAEDGQVWAAMYDAAPEAPIAAPAAANGALTDERAAFEASKPTMHIKRNHFGMYENLYVHHAWEAWQDRAALAALIAAAGPDAALVKALEEVIQPGGMYSLALKYDGIVGTHIDGLTATADRIRAALSGAKGN